jgi:hypothetical protein
VPESVSHNLSAVGRGSHPEVRTWMTESDNTGNPVSPKAVRLFPRGRTKLQAACHRLPLLQTLSNLANDMLFAMESALTLGGTEWLNATKRIGANCVLPWRTRPTPTNLVTQVQELIKALDEGEQN